MKRNLKGLQNEINELYIEAFNEYKGGLNLSVPLIPKISANYFDNKVVIIGQETNTWFRSNNLKNTDDLKDIFLKNLDKIEDICLIQRYDYFIKNIAGKYNSNFWRFQRELYLNNVLGGQMIYGTELRHC